MSRWSATRCWRTTTRASTRSSATCPSFSATIIENLTLVEGKSGVNGTGGGAGNIIVGNSANNVLLGLAGNDRLTGNAGDDTLDGGENNDTLAGGLGNDIYRLDSAFDRVSEGVNQGIDLVESKVSHTLGANFENLTLLDDGDLETAEQALGNGGANIIKGNSENNFINGLGGADTMEGGNGDDLYRIDSAGDKIVETPDPGSGIDTVQSAISIPVLWDNVENVFLFGTGGVSASSAMTPITTCPAISAPITCAGGIGDDTLNGGGANDVLTGGTGRDVFLRANEISQGVDTVTDFEVSATTGDFIDITDLLVAGGKDIFFEGTSDLTDFVHAVSDGKGNTLVQVDPNGGPDTFSTVFILQGVTLTQDQLELQVLTEHPT